MTPLSGLTNIISDIYSSVIHHWNCQLKPILFLHWKNRVNWGLYSPRTVRSWVKRCLFSCRLSQSVRLSLSSQSLRLGHPADLVSFWDLISQSNIVSQSVKVKRSIKLWYLIVISVNQAISLSKNFSFFSFKIWLLRAWL